jgi:hypothetical protein
MTAAGLPTGRLPLSPAILGEEEVAFVLTRLRRASESLRVVEREAARHASVSNSLVGLACVAQLVIAEIDAVCGVVERASLRA